MADILLLVGAVTFVVAVAIAYAWTWRGIQDEIVDAINSAESEEDKAEIKLKVVKALYPPRFNR